jgi:hypothetical protein
MSDSHDSFEAHDDPENTPSAWSEQNCNLILKPIQNLFTAMPAEELANWSAITICLVHPTTSVLFRLEPGLVTKTKRALSRQLANPAIKRIPSVLFVDFIQIKERIIVPSRQIDARFQWWNVGVHGLVNLRAHSPEATLFISALTSRYSGSRSIEIGPMPDLTDGFACPLTNHYTPSKHVTCHKDKRLIYNRMHPVKGSLATEFRQYLSENSIVPADLVLMRGMRLSLGEIRIDGHAMGERIDREQINGHNIIRNEPCARWYH